MEYKDRTGKIIHPGDIVVSQLGAYGKKSGGPVRCKIARSKKGLRLQFWLQGTWTPGHLLRPADLERLTIVDTSEREKS